MLSVTIQPVRPVKAKPAANVWMPITSLLTTVVVYIASIHVRSVQLTIYAYFAPLKNVIYAQAIVMVTSVRLSHVITALMDFTVMIDFASDANV